MIVLNVESMLVCKIVWAPRAWSIRISTMQQNVSAVIQDMHSMHYSAYYASYCGTKCNITNVYAITYKYNINSYATVCECNNYYAIQYDNCDNA